MHPHAPLWSVFAFAGLPVVVGALGVFGLLRACPPDRSPTPLRIVAWLVVLATFVVPAGLASSGALLRFDVKPPPFMVMMFLLLAGGTWLALSSIGRAVVDHYGFGALIGLQVFRLPLELAMHGAADAGVMPPVMSYSGRNFDILTGVAAALVLLVYRQRPVPRPVAWAFNVLGFGLLVNVMIVAIRATPFLAHFGPEQINTWVAYVPFVWLPSVLVITAWVSHLLLFRKLLRERQTTLSSAAVAASSR